MVVDCASSHANPAWQRGPAGGWRLWRRARQSLRTWCNSDSGGAAVEFAVVAPVLIMIVTGIIQFGAVFFLQNNMNNAAQEAARALAVGTIQTASDAQTLVNQTVVNWGVTFTVQTTMPNPPTDNDFTVVITAPMSEAAIFDYLGVFEGTLRAEASMRQET